MKFKLLQKEKELMEIDFKKEELELTKKLIKKSE